MSAMFDAPPRAPRTFVVDGEPVALGRPRVAVIQGKARLYTPTESVDHKGLVVEAATAAGVVSHPGLMGLDVVGSWLFLRSWSPARIVSELHRLRDDPRRIGEPKDTKPDADNVLKLVADALNGLAYNDDGCLWLMRSAKVWGPRAETHVRLWYGSTPPAFPDRWW